MGYYVRAFCTSETIPSLAQVEQELKAAWPAMRFETEDDRHAVPWEGVEFYYSDAAQPILVELNVNDAPDSMAAEEAQEFIDDLEDVEDEAAKAKVVQHLQATRYVVCCQFLGDVPDEGFEANEKLLDIFVAKYGGMVQADGEGFYEGSDLLIDMS